MKNGREVETAYPFDDALARARVVHVAEGILVCLRGCTTEQAFAEMVAVARSAGRSVFTVASELMEIAIGSANRAAVEQYWNARLTSGAPRRCKDLRRTPR